MTRPRPRIVCVPDSFKGSASAAEVAAAMARGARQAAPQADIIEVPFADGGEGTLEAILADWGTAPETAEVVDALGRPITARFGWSPDRQSVIIEAAQANGLPQVSDAEPAPLHADSFGVGMIAAGVLDEAEEILLCIGGSASTDGGTGLLRALGVRFEDAAGDPVAPGGAGLAAIAAIDTSGLHPRARQVRWQIAVDVDNPLTGPRGAAAVFGPQKGANAADIAALDAGLGQLAEVLAAWSEDEAQASAATAAQLCSRPGFGAAGGMPVTLSVLLGATTVPGSQLVAEAVGLDRALSGADLILTGEGSLDSQSLAGKVVDAVLHHADRRAPVVAVAGTVQLTPAECRAAGLTAAFSIAPGAASLQTLLAEAEELIEAAAAHACALALTGTPFASAAG